MGFDPRLIVITDLSLKKEVLVNNLILYGDNLGNDPNQVKGYY